MTRVVSKRAAKPGKTRPALTASRVDATRQFTKTPTRLPDISSDQVLSQHSPPASAVAALAEHKAATAALGRAPDAPRLNPDGTPVSPDVIEAPLIAAVSNRPEAVAAGQNAHVNDPVATTAESLETSRSGWATTLKSVLTSNFILVALAGAAVGTYFAATAEMRRKCIRDVFAKYPQFTDSDAIERLMEGYGNQPCGTTDSNADKQCAAVHDAYHRLKECDNTLMKNIVDAVLNAGAQVTNFFGDEVTRALQKLTGVFSGALPIILGVVGAIILACIALWFFTRERGGHGAPGPANRLVGNVRGRFREQAFGRHMRARAY